MERRLALITGGTSGIGFGIAQKLALQYDLVLVFANDTHKAEQSINTLKKLVPEGRFESIQKILGKPEEAKSLCDEAKEKMNGVNPSVLINSAGRIRDGLFLGSDFSEHVELIQEHLLTTMALTHACLKGMYQAKFGRIINMSSISASYCKRGQTSYSAAKSGIEGFTKTLALEVAHRGITVNAIAPGLIETPMTAELIKNIEDGGLKKRIPAGRMGQPSEVGALAEFLCSSDAAYITGTVITIDGGRSLGDPQS